MPTDTPTLDPATRAALQVQLLREVAEGIDHVAEKLRTMARLFDRGGGGRRVMMCEGCANDRHDLCGMQTWCTCDCAGPDGLYLDDGDGLYPCDVADEEPES